MIARRSALAVGAAACAAVLVCGACQETEAPPPAPAADRRPVVLFLGTSLTAGYGLSAEEAFPALIQQRIDAADLGYRTVNAGVSGDTSAGGLRRIDWLLQLPLAVLVLELGANDMLRGLDVAALRKNLAEIVTRARAAHPELRLVVAGMRAPPNLGREYVDAFEAVFPALAGDADGVLVRFLLDGVAGEPSLNQADGIHPTAAGHERISDTLWRDLAPLLRSGESHAPAATAAPPPGDSP
ncbi:MAG: arylesterase [Myxococcota bacterium]